MFNNCFTKVKCSVLNQCFYLFWNDETGSTSSYNFLVNSSNILIQSYRTHDISSYSFTFNMKSEKISLKSFTLCLQQNKALLHTVQVGTVINNLKVVRINMSWYQIFKYELSNYK